MLYNVQIKLFVGTKYAPQTVPLTDLLQFGARECITITTLTYSKPVNWNDMEEQYQFQLEALPVYKLYII